MVLFILNIFVKAALLYSAMTVAVAVSSANCDTSDNVSERGLSSMHSPKSLDAGHEERLTPAHSFQSEVEVGDQGIDIPMSPGYGTPGVSGLISPGYDPRALYSP